MMKKLIVAFLLMAATTLHATTYYANLLTGQNINYTTAGAGWYPTQGTSCVATGTPVAVGSFANGDVLNANGCTGIAVNVDPGAATGASAGVCGTVTVTVTLTTDTSLGGTFTYATATNIVMHTNILPTKTTALTITGSTGGGTICGNTNGSNTASVDGVIDSHTAVTLYLIGTPTGGTYHSGNEGYTFNSSTGSLAVTGNPMGSLGDGVSGSGTITVAGNCTGGTSAGYAAAGCNGSSNIRPMTITGNIINSLSQTGTIGAVLWTPAAGNYIIGPKDTSYTLGTINSHAIVACANNYVLSGTSCVAPSSAASQGYAY